MADKFYPPISDLLSLNALPDELSFLKGKTSGGLSAFFDKIYYRNLRVLPALDGGASYSIDLLFSEELELELPGTDLSLILNKDYTTGSSSIIPISFSYQLPILKYIRNFKLQNFSFDESGFFDIVFFVKPTIDTDLILQTITAFVDNANSIQEFADNYQTDASSTHASLNPVDSDINIALQDIVTAIYADGSNPKTYIFNQYITGSRGSGSAIENFNQLFSLSFGTEPIKYITSLFKPNITARLAVIPGIEFPRNILKPYVLDPGTSTLKLVPDPIKFTLLVNDGNGPLEIFYSSNGGFGFSDSYGASPAPIPYGQNQTPLVPIAEIGNSGFKIQFGTVKLDLSKQTNIPEADNDGRPDSFTGVFIDTANITIPDKFVPGTGANAVIVGKNLLIGTGGLSGTIGMELINPAGGGTPLIPISLGGFTLNINSFTVTFRQNAIIGSEILGTLALPTSVSSVNDAQGNPIDLQVRAAFNADGDFTLTVKEPEGIDLNFGNIFTVRLTELNLGEVGGRWFVNINGAIKLTKQIDGLTLMPDFAPVLGVTLWDDGEVDFKGGNIPIPQSFELDFGSTKISISNMEFGKKMIGTRNYSFFGFNGALDMSPGGVDVSGNGIKYYFTASGTFNHFLEIGGIKVDISLPSHVEPKDAKVRIQGFVSMANPDTRTIPTGKLPNGNPKQELFGAVAFQLQLKKGGISGGAAMRLNKNDSSFVVDAFLDMDKPIPLGSTGLGIYGFRGLIGQRYMPDKVEAGLSPQADWWAYYKANPRGINIKKFANKDGFAVGAGATIGTLSDDGYTFTSQLMLLLALPDLLMLSGKAAILADRLKYNINGTGGEPPFFAMLAISKQQVSANLGANYRIPSTSGKILMISAEIEAAYFFDNPKGWFLNIGRDYPVEKRVRAIVFNLFDSYAYLMVNYDGIRAGAGVSYYVDKKYGPVKVYGYAGLSAVGFISFRPMQLGGAIAVKAGFGIKVSKFRLSFEGAAGLRAETPKPLIIAGYVSVKMKVPWPIKKIKVKVSLTWVKNPNNDTNAVPLLNVPSAQNPNSPLPVNAIHMLTGESFPISYGTYNQTNNVIPLDCFIDINFSQGINPVGVSNIGGKYFNPNSSFLSPPVKGHSNQVSHELRVTSVNIKIKNGGSWNTYDLFEDCTAVKTALDANLVSTANLKDGYWQLDSNQKITKLRIGATNVFSYTTGSVEGVYRIEENELNPGSIFCGDEPELPVTINWDTNTLNTIYSFNQKEYKTGIEYYFTRAFGIVENIPGTHPTINGNGLQFKDNAEARFDFEETVVDITLNFFNKSPKLTVKFYNESDSLIKTEIRPNTNPSGSFETISFNNSGNPAKYFTVEYDGPVSVNVSPLFVARRASAWGGGSYLNGKLHNLILCDNIASDSEITDNFNDNTITPPSTLVHFPLDGSNTSPQGVPISNSGAVTAGVLTPPTHQVFSGSEYMLVTNTFNSFTQLVGGDFTIIFNVKRNGPTGLEIILDNRGTSGYHVFLYQDRIGYQMMSDNKYSNKTVNFNVCDGNWHHIALTVNATTKEVKTFIDGVLRRTTTDNIPDRIVSGGNLDDSVYLKDITYLTEAKNNYNNNAITTTEITTEIQEAQQVQLHAYQPIWRPNSEFLIEIRGEDIVNGVSKLLSYDLKFRTEGPIGFYNLDTKEVFDRLPDEEKEKQVTFSTLKNYIDYEHSYPNAEGILKNEKPVYCDTPIIKLVFQKAYVNSMFKDWSAAHGQGAISSEIETLLFNANGNGAPINPNVSTLTPIAFDYEETDQKLIYYIGKDNQSCLSSVPPLTSKNYTGNYVFDELEKNTLYTAVFNGRYQAAVKELHRYNFMSSKYLSFQDHIQSFYHIDSQGNQRKKLRSISVTLDGTKTTLIDSILDGSINTNSPTYKLYQTDFERIVNGGMELNTLPVVEHTEVNLIKDQSQNLKAILVRSPEPFWIPKLKLADYTLVEIDNILQSSGLSDPDTYNVRASNDNSCLIITKNDLTNIDPGTFEITFNHFELTYNSTTNQYDYENAASGGANISESISFTLI